MYNTDTLLKLKTTLDSCNNIHELRDVVKGAMDQFSELVASYESLGSAVLKQDNNEAMRVLSGYVEENPGAFPDFIYVEQVADNPDGSADFNIVMGEDIDYEFSKMAQEQNVTKEEILVNTIRKQIEKTVDTNTK